MFKMLNKTIQAELSKLGQTPTKQEVFATTAMMIGGVAIGRALNDNHTTEILLESCRNAAIELLKLK